MNGALFLAVALDPESQHGLAAALTEARGMQHIPGRKTSPPDWHITLRYVGECEDWVAERIAYSVSQDMEASPERVWATGIDAFGRRAASSVVYAAIDDPTGIISYLAAVCNDAAVDAGFEPDTRPFVPHVTLSTLRPTVDMRPVLETFDSFRTAISIDAVTVFRSTSSSPGHSYTAIATIPLTDS